MEAVSARASAASETLMRLLERSKHADSVGGGCFEWVDSLLVKALRHGHWLLIDNVNLCSASVLDRLNGLLEPNGVLTLSERGVIDGTIPTIVPHPEFRLFLALDPRHGEISRAMRNRGVEIFMDGSDDCDYLTHDLLSLVRAVGLTSTYLQNVLLELHQWLCQLLPAGDRPTLTELVQVASLTAQRLEMLNINAFTCLEEICTDVYIRNIRLDTDKEAARIRLSESIQSAVEQLKNAQSAEQEHQKRIVGSDSVVSTREVQLCSAFARVRQATGLIEHQLKRQRQHQIQGSSLTSR